MDHFFRSSYFDHFAPISIVVLLLCITFALPSISGTDCIFMSLCTYTVGHLKILQSDFSNIGKKRSKLNKRIEESEALEQLKICIKRHIELIAYTKDLEKIFSLQAILQYISSSLTICFIIFQFASVNYV